MEKSLCTLARMEATGIRGFIWRAEASLFLCYTPTQTRQDTSLQCVRLHDKAVSLELLMKIGLLGTLVVVGVVGLWVVSRLGRTPIGLSSVQTSGTPQGCEIVVAVARRDGLVGLSHGAAPELKRAWLSDGEGKEIVSDGANPLLTEIKVATDDGLGGKQWGWRVAPRISHPPARVVFHATFVARGAEPFEFEQDLRDGIDFNASSKP